MLRLGYHINKTESTFEKSINDGLKIGTKHGFDIKYLQIYVVGPNDSFEILNDKDKEYFKELSNTFTIIVHASHLDHILGHRNYFTIMNIKKELKICKEIGAYGLIIHLPDKKPKDIVEVLDIIVSDKEECDIYFEMDNYHSKSKYKYTDISNLKKIFKIISTRNYSDKIGLVIDTSHIWTSGIDIQSYDSANNWISRFKKLNIKKIILHLNDQKWEFGSGSDEHISITYGTMWKKYNIDGFHDIKDSGLLAFIEWAKNNNIIIILERKNINDINKDLLILSKIQPYLL